MMPMRVMESLFPLLWIRFGFSPSASLSPDVFLTIMELMFEPNVLMTEVVPPMTLALPGITFTVVTPYFNASVNPGSRG